MLGFDVFNIVENEPPRKIDNYIVFMFAPPKFGKSSFAANFEDVLFLAFEKGYNALRVKPADITDWRFFVKKIVDPLEKAYQAGKKLPYKSLAFDTVDKAADMCHEYVCRREGVTHPSEVEWGKGWAFIKEEFSKQIHRCTKMGLGVIFLSHSEVKTFKPKNKEEFTKVVPTLDKRSREVLLPLADMIIFGDLKIDVESGNETRMLYLRETAEFEAGCRLHFMPDMIDFGLTAEQGYSNFIKEFDKAVELQFGRLNPPSDPNETYIGWNSVGDECHSRDKQKTKLNEDKKLNTGVPEDVQEVDLDDVKKELEQKLTTLYEDGVKSPVELVKLIKEHCGVSRISEIDNVESAQKLLGALV